MHRVAVLLSVAALAFVLPSVATADPSGPNVQGNLTYTCDGKTVVLNGGTITNRSHQSFVVDSPSIFVVNYFEFVTPTGTTIVVFDTAPGLTDLVTCTTTVNGFHLTLRGFFTPST